MEDFVLGLKLSGIDVLQQSRHLLEVTRGHPTIRSWEMTLLFIFRLT